MGPLAYLVCLEKWVLEAFPDQEGLLDCQVLRVYLVLKATKAQRETKGLLDRPDHPVKRVAKDPLAPL